MNSYIFSFKKIIFAIFIILILEYLILYFLKPPSVFDSNLFERNYIKPDNRASFIIASKIEQSQNVDYKFIQVGGSEGLHGVIPKKLNKNYYNASCCRNTGYLGYEIIAYTILDNLNKKYGNKSRNVLLVLSPSSIPHENNNLIENDLSKLLEENFISKKGILLNSVPSISFRSKLSLKKNSYESIKLNTTMTLDAYATEQIYNILLANDGFIKFPNTGIFNYPNKDHFIKIYNNISIFENWLNRFELKLKQRNAKLTVIFTPAPFTYKNEDKIFIYKIINKIKEDFSGVNVIDQFVFDKSFNFHEYWGDDIHLNQNGAKIFSEKLSVIVNAIY